MNIQPANLDWQVKDGIEIPTSKQYSDIYFLGDGIQESEYVFLEANQLPKRWCNQQHYCIGELGFGTGLNFILTWAKWNESKRCGEHSQSAKLTYIGIDKHPLSKQDLMRCHNLWSQSLGDLSQSLLQHYPYLIKGFHLLKLAEDVDLILIWDEAERALQQLLSTIDYSETQHNAKVDNWYLDGFAPRKNTQMWSLPIFELIAQLSKYRACLTTFTAASAVRKTLEQVGFSVTRLPGFRYKRQMISAEYYPNTHLSKQSPKLINQPRHLNQLPNWHLHKLVLKDRTATIIGAGVSGCSVAHSLAQRGWQVKVIEQHSSVGGYCPETETVLQQVALYSKLSKDSQSLLGQFSLAALQFAQRYQPLQRCGLAQVAQSQQQEREYEQLANLVDCSDFVCYKTRQQLSKLCDISIQYGGLWFANSGWMQPERVCEQLLQHCNINVSLGTRFTDILDKNTSVTILATARSSVLPLKLLAGQIDYLPTYQPFNQLRSIVCSTHSLMPKNADNHHYLGSSYRQSTNTSINSEETAQAIQAMSGILTDDFITDMELNRQIGIRATTPDFLPIVGAIPDIKHWEVDFGNLQYNARQSINANGHYLPHLYTITGMGSRGFCYAPICAEILAAELSNEPCPVPLGIRRALHSGRFVLRSLMKPTAYSTQDTV